MASWISQNDTADGTNDYKTSKKVGIGTTSPIAPLDFGPTLGDKIFLFPGDANASYGFGIQSYLLQMFAYGGADIAFGTGNSGNFTESVRIKSSGNVGIGCISPASKLAVSGGASIGGNYADDAAPSNGLIVEGKTGIGTSSPTGLLHLNGVCTGGSGDYTNASTQLKIQETSDSWRIAHISSNPGISGFYNYETGKSVYWGETSDTGTYYFRGRSMEITQGSLGIGGVPAEKLEVGGNIQISGNDHGLILLSPNGHRWKLTINNNGNTSWTDLDA